MIRYFSATLAAATLCLACAYAQDVVPVNHPHAVPVVVDGSSCANGNCAAGHCATGDCGKCSDCVRITEIKKTPHPVYACKVKEICIPNCGFFGLFGCKGDCKKIEVRQLVKKYRINEECVSKCVTPEEAAKHYEAEAKKAAEKAKAHAPAPVPARLSTGPVSFGNPTFQPLVIDGVPTSSQPTVRE